MYKKHPHIKEPDDNLIIWRYIDFTKFVSLLDTKKLFFTRADKFSDTFEGSYTKANKEMRQKFYTFMDEKMLFEYPELLKKLRKFTLINCWHINDYESAAMWDLYSSISKGIAIQSTVKNLKECFQCAKEEIIIGRVKYIDYNTTIIPESNSLFSYFRKRKSYEHENELRAILLKYPEAEEGIIDSNKEVCNIGIYVDVNINTLVENIYISPSAEDWFVKLVKDIILKYEYNSNVVNSELNSDPVW